MATVLTDGWEELDAMLPQLAEQATDDGWGELDSMIPDLAQQGANFQLGRQWVTQRVRDTAGGKISTPSISTDFGDKGAFWDVRGPEDFQSRVKQFRGSPAYQTTRKQAETEFRSKFPTVDFDKAGERLDDLETKYQLAREFVRNESSAYSVWPAVQQLKPGPERSEFLAILADIALKSEPDRGFINKAGERVYRGTAGIMENLHSLFGTLNESDERFLREAQSIRRNQDAAGKMVAAAWQEGGVFGVAESGALSAAEMFPPMVASAMLTKGAGGIAGAGAKRLGASAATAATATRIAGMSAGTSFWWSQSAPAMAREFQDAGFDERTAWTAASIAAVPHALVETLQVQGLVKGKALLQAKQAASKTVAEEIRKQMTKSGAQFLEQFGQEAAQELIELATKNALDSIGFDQRGGFNWKQELGQSGEELLQAAVSLPFLMGPGRAAEAVGEAFTERELGERAAQIMRDRAEWKAERTDPTETLETWAEQRERGRQPAPAEWLREPLVKASEAQARERAAGQANRQQTASTVAQSLAADHSDAARAFAENPTRSAARKLARGTGVPLPSLDGQWERDAFAEQIKTSLEPPAEQPGVAVMITSAMRQQLRDLGYDDAAIRSMTPQQANDAIRQPDVQLGEVQDVPQSPREVREPQQPTGGGIVLTDPATGQDVEIGGQPPPTEAASRPFAVGDKFRVPKREGQTDEFGVITAVHDDGTYDVNWPDTGRVSTHAPLRHPVGNELLRSTTPVGVVELVEPSQQQAPGKPSTGLENLGEMGGAIAANLRTAWEESIQRTGKPPSAETNSIAGQFWSKLMERGHQPSRETFNRFWQVGQSGAFDSAASAREALDREFPQAQAEREPKRGAKPPSRDLSLRQVLGEKTRPTSGAVARPKLRIAFTEPDVTEADVRELLSGYAIGSVRRLGDSGQQGVGSRWRINFKNNDDLQAALDRLGGNLLIGDQQSRPTRDIDLAEQPKTEATGEFEQPYDERQDPSVQAGVERLKLRYGADVEITDEDTSDADVADAIAFLTGFGAPQIVFVRSKATIGAVTYRSPSGNIVYLQLGSGQSLWRGVADEVGHLSRAGRGVFTDAEVEERKRSYLRQAPKAYREFLRKNPAHLREEAEASLVADFLERADFRAELQAKQPGLFVRLVNAVLDLIGDQRLSNPRWRALLNNLRETRDNIRAKQAKQAVTLKPAATSSTTIKGAPVADVLRTEDGKVPATGEPATVVGYRGHGRETRESAYAEGVGPIFGEWSYYAISEEDAKDFGPQVEERTIELRNPLVINNDADVKQLLGVTSLPYDNETRSRLFPAAADELRRKGHDGIIINVPFLGDVDSRGNNVKRMREIFDATQVVVFEKPTRTPRGEKVAPQLSADMSEADLEAWLNQQAGVEPVAPQPKAEQPKAKQPAVEPASEQFALTGKPKPAPKITVAPDSPEAADVVEEWDAIARDRENNAVFSADDLAILDALMQHEDMPDRDKQAYREQFTVRRNPDTTGEADEFIGYLVPQPKTPAKKSAPTSKPKTKSEKKPSLKEKAEQAIKERDEAWDDLSKYLRNKIAPPSLGSADPELVALASKVVAKSVKAGVLQFRVLVSDSVDRLGEQLAREIAPLLQRHWDTLRGPWSKATGQEMDESTDTNTLIEEINRGRRTESDEGGPATVGTRNRQDVEGVPPAVREGDGGAGGVLGTGARGAEQRGGDDRGADETGSAGDRGGQRGDEGVRGPARPGRAASRPERLTYRITDADEIGGGATFQKKRRYRLNVDAIRLLKQIEGEGRRATADEQKVLVRYVGWGGLKEAFGKGEDKFRKGWEREVAELRELLTPEEYKAAKASIINAHFTSPEAVSAIWRGIQSLGFSRGRVVEPAMGTGLFFGLMPGNVAEHARLVGVEMDDLTARIAKQLYQAADIKHSPFQTVDMADGSADLFISNVPFGKITVHDRKDRSIPSGSVHDFFFNKAIKKVRPGGLVVFITSRFSLDKVDSSARSAWAKLGADLLGAVRLPNNAFKGVADTSVTTDIIVLQKRAAGEAQGGEAFEKAVDHQSEGETFRVNEYFAAHPENILGELAYTGSMHGENELTVEPLEGADLGKEIADAIAKMPVNRSTLDAVTTATGEAYEDETAPLESHDAPKGFREAGLLVKDGRLYQNLSGKLIDLPIPRTQRGKPGLNALARIQKALGVYDAAIALVDAEVSETSDESLNRMRTDLNRVYDEFTRSYGPISKATNTTYYRDDTLALSLLLSLEEYDEDTGKATKADIFNERIRFPRTVKTSADSAEEAFALSMAERGDLDVAYVAQLLGVGEEQATAQLGDLAYRNPAGGWESRTRYLSGNVRDKLVEAKEAAKRDPSYQRNVEALEKVQPEDLPPSLIDVKLGAPWVPAEVYADFVDDTLGKEVQFRYVASEGTWVLDNTGSRMLTAKETGEYGTDRLPALRLLEKSMNHREIVIRDRDDDGNLVVNKDATALANARLEKLRRAFDSWLFSDAARAERLVRLYNDQFNSSIETNHDGAYLTLPGMAEWVRKLLNPHQVNAVSRFLTHGNTGLFHVVGAGKSWTMAAQIMEARRLGLVRKPIVVIPNHMLRSGQFAREFKQAYPAARLLVATSEDLAPKERQALVQRIRTGDWDAVIIAQSSFERIPMAPDIMRDFFQQQIDELEAEIREAKSQGQDRERSYEAELEAAKQRLEEFLAKLSAEWKKDTGPYFNELGVDGMWVDEAHAYKNLWYRTKMTRVAGAQSTFAQKSFDMLMKTQFINQMTNERGIVFATGTPIANSIGEMFTLFRYLAPSQLDARGISAFDSWADTFGRTVTETEVKPTGAGFRQHTRFSSFANVPELASMFRSFADVQIADDLKEILGRPEMRGAKPTTVPIPANPYLKAIVDDLVHRVEAILSGAVDPKIDNMLAVTTDGRKAALDIRLIDPNMPDLPDSKVNVAVENIARVHRETAGQQGTQLVWMDLTSPTTKGPINLYHELRDKLVKAGIPRDEIAIVHEHDKNAGKLFKKVRQGKVRVLIGSTAKMGTGTNVQTRLVASHHLDPPWRPADVEQRDGRILRRGNRNKLVDVYQYVTENSFDAYSWSTLERKAKFIAQAMSSDKSVRTIQDVSKQALTFGEIKAIAANNPKLMEFTQLEAEVMQIAAEQAGHRDEQYRLSGRITMERSALKHAKDELPKYKADAETVER
jgi:N12 class adenine-specific DNA methylase